MIEFAGIADRVIATTQHPRSEGPEQILADIKRHKPDMETADEPTEALRALANGLSKEECLVWFGPGNLEYREFAEGKRPYYPRKIIAEVFGD
jgi:UDP-N-acetylmuramyl tripeptide synthase